MLTYWLDQGNGEHHSHPKDITRRIPFRSCDHIWILYQVQGPMPTLPLGSGFADQYPGRNDCGSRHFSSARANISLQIMIPAQGFSAAEHQGQTDRKLALLLLKFNLLDYKTFAVGYFNRTRKAVSEVEVLCLARSTYRSQERFSNESSSGVQLQDVSNSPGALGASRVNTKSFISEISLSTSSIN